jgi:uncharacterized protein
MTETILPLWYEKGLSFKCTGCGRCCTGSPGVVWISEEEIEKAAQFLNMKMEDFCKKHVRKLGDRLALMEIKRGKDYDCTFLQDGKCSIYNFRPKQCKTFPWWSENLESKEAWDAVAKDCEGINHEDAPLISLGEIQEELK